MWYICSNFDSQIYLFLNWSLKSSQNFSFCSLNNRFFFFFFGTNSSLRFIPWFYIFFISILFDTFFLNIFKYLWNFLKTISSTILTSIKSSYFFPTILAISISFLTVSFLNSFFLCLFFILFLLHLFCLPLLPISI